MLQHMYRQRKRRLGPALFSRHMFAKKSRWFQAAVIFLSVYFHTIFSMLWTWKTLQLIFNIWVCHWNFPIIWKSCASIKKKSFKKTYLCSFIIGLLWFTFSANDNDAIISDNFWLKVLYESSHFYTKDTEVRFCMCA